MKMKMNRKTRKAARMNARAAALRAVGATLVQQVIVARCYEGPHSPLTGRETAVLRRAAGMVKLRHYAAR
jgi:hypothetical protein